MAVGVAVRSRTSLCGYAACVCRKCTPRGTGQKRYVKRLTARSVRLSERKEVMTELEMMREGERVETMERLQELVEQLAVPVVHRRLQQVLMDMEVADRYFDSMYSDDLYSDDDWC